MIREGDIESIRRKAQLDGRPMKSSAVVDKKGKIVHFTTDKKGRVKIKD